MANYPLAFGELLAGAILLDKGVAAFKTGLGNTSASGSSTGGVAPSPSASSGDGLGATSTATATGVAYVKTLTGLGLTPTAAAGVVGNLYQESKLNPGEAGGGLAQWQGSWFQQMSAWVSARSMSASSAIGQLTYIANDLATSYPGLLAAMNAASDPADAALLFSNNYEHPGIPDNQNREDFATAVYAAAGY